MIAPIDVIIWALLGGLVAALLNSTHGDRYFGSRALGFTRVLLVGTLSGIALSALALSLAPHCTVTRLLSGSDRWELAFVIGAASQRIGPLALSVLHRLLHNQENKV